MMRRFTLSEVTGIAEIIGSIGIIASLVFVGLQVRQNTHQVEAASYQTGIAYIDAINNLATDPDTAELVIKGLKDFEALSQVEKARFDGIVYNVMNKFFLARQVYLQGSLARSDYETYEDLLARILRSPGAALWFAKTRYILPKDVTSVVDSILQRYPSVEPMSDYYTFAHEPQYGPQGQGK